MAVRKRVVWAEIDSNVQQLSNLACVSTRDHCPALSLRNIQLWVYLRQQKIETDLFREVFTHVTGQNDRLLQILVYKLRSEIIVADIFNKLSRELEFYFKSARLRSGYEDHPECRGKTNDLNNFNFDFRLFSPRLLKIVII